MNFFFIVLCYVVPPVVALIGAYLLLTFNRSWIGLMFILIWVASIVASVSWLNALMPSLLVPWWWPALAWGVGSGIAWVVASSITDDGDDDEDEAQAGAAVDDADS